MFNKFYARIVTVIVLVMMIAAIPLEAAHQPVLLGQLSAKQPNTLAHSDNDKSLFDMQKNANENSEPDEKIQDHWHEVIVKWKVGELLPLIPGTKLISKDVEERLAKLSVDEGVSVQEVIAFAANYAELEYIQPNYRYKLHATPNDPEYPQQWHHKQVNMPRAWDLYKGNTNIIIAVLDTGVDLEHPDLKPNLVPGHNIISPEHLPIDDYGHGTQVAGVLGAVGNNQQNGSGILWNARIMPIKVLDGSGEGDDFTIGQGIRYAVRNGANIIVLSLGDRLFSKHMEEAVTFAEQEGVLLIAATGNNGSTVNYPAAFPTVLAVGASDTDDRVPSYSNFGPEVDVVAPGQGIYTTTMRGQMTYNSGTSMSAPIVAGIAALILNKYPTMKPWEVRQLLRQSAVGVGSQVGWNQRSGYGRVDAFRALTIKPEIDLWATNNTWEQAKIFPLHTAIHSALKGVNDTDWFYIDVEHRGKVQAPLTTEYTGISMNWYRYIKQDDQPRGELVPIIYSSDRILEPGRYYIRIRVNNWNAIIQTLQKKGIHQNQYGIIPMIYQINQRFLIAEDRYEPNNTINQAAAIDVYQAERFDQGKPFVLIEGTLHRDGDYDWYALDLPHPGVISIEIVNSYGRMDPVLTLSRKLTTNIREYEVIDDHAHGAGEFWQGNVDVGPFYFMVADYQLRSHPVPYQVKITYTPKYDDRWEPNKTRLEAPTIVVNSDIYAFLDGNQDRDWFGFIVEEQADVVVELTALLPDMVLEGVGLTVRVFESTKETPTHSKTVNDSRKLVLTENFSPGVYYLQLLRTGNQSAMNQQVPYKLRVNNRAAAAIQPVLIINAPKHNQVFSTIGIEITGYTDPGSTLSLNGKIIEVDQDGRFKAPYLFENTGVQTLRFRSTNPAGNRSERTIQTNYKPPIVFTDLATSEQRQSVYYLTERNIVQGFPDKTFRPNRSLTRGEMVTLILRSLNVDIAQEARTIGGTRSIRDVDSKHWAYNAMIVAVQRGLIVGFIDQTLRPEEPVTRAQLATMLERAYRNEVEMELIQMAAGNPLPSIKFRDVPTRHWAYQEIQRNTIVGYMTTMEGQYFYPDQAATRQQVVNALYRIVQE